MKKYFVLMFAILNLFPILLLSQDVEEKVIASYTELTITSTTPKDSIALLAKTTDYVIYIDGEEALTSNPIVTIDGYIYLPMEEVTEIFGMGVNYNEEKERIEFTEKSEKEYITLEEYMKIFKDFDPENISQEQESIQKGISSGTIHPLYPREMKNESIRNMRASTSILVKGMPRESVTEVLGAPFDIGSGSYIPMYFFGCGERLVLGVDDWERGVLSTYNRYNIDLLLTRHFVTLEKAPVFIDGEEFKVKNSLVTIDKKAFEQSLGLSKVYLSLEDFSAIFGVNFTVNWQDPRIKVTMK